MFYVNNIKLITQDISLYLSPIALAVDFKMMVVKYHQVKK